MKWSFIVFCYNEEYSIEKVITDCYSFISSQCSGNGEIIFVNDGSTDKSLEIAEALLPQIGILKIIHHQQNLGIGSALNAGYDHAQGEYICAIPGDGQFKIEELISIEEFGDDHFISFYRTHKGYSFYRNVLTYGNFLLNKYINNIHIKDVNWIKVYRRNQLKQISRNLKSSLVESEIAGKLIKLKISPIELPSEYVPRAGDKAKGGNLKTLIQAIRETLKLYQSIHKK